MKTLEKVHVIPLGFERSVAVKPIRVLGGSRVHVITIGGKYAAKYELHDKQKYFEEAVRSDLERMGVEVEVHYADLFDFKMAVGKISRVIVEEKKRGSEIYVNISAHGRLVSVASALAGWYHGARVYYVFPERYARDEEEERLYGRSVCENPVIFELPRVEFVKLTEEEKFAISLIYSKVQSGREYVSLEEVIEEFSKKFPHIYSTEAVDRMSRQQRQKLTTKINRRVLEKLEAKGYIDRDKIGRNTILRLTELGEFFALLEAGL